MKTTIKDRSDQLFMKLTFATSRQRAEALVAVIEQQKGEQ